uniref:Uncharacterized protein n=1 Tax=Meloidogyne hapla TaxID=6305 RepID=A0A1I8BP17_MELHA
MKFSILLIFLLFNTVQSLNDSNILFPMHGPFPPNVNACFAIDGAHALSIGPAITPNKDILLMIAYILDLGLLFVLAVLFRVYANIRKKENDGTTSIRFSKGPLGI